MLGFSLPGIKMSIVFKNLGFKVWGLLGSENAHIRIICALVLSVPYFRFFLFVLCAFFVVSDFCLLFFARFFVRSDFCLLFFARFLPVPVFLARFFTCSEFCPKFLARVFARSVVVVVVFLG